MIYYFSAFSGGYISLAAAVLCLSDCESGNPPFIKAGILYEYALN
jgi:hypothetical protein